MTCTRRATCPTCRRSGRFQACGKQQWPHAVADAHGLATEIALWSCPHCHTTICEMDLLPAAPSAPARA